MKGKSLAVAMMAAIGMGAFMGDGRPAVMVDDPLARRSLKVRSRKPKPEDSAERMAAAESKRERRKARNLKNQEAQECAK